MSNAILNLIDANAMDKLVIDSLSSLDINLKHARKLELSARLQGYPSLNHRKADEKSIKNESYRLLVSGIEAVEGEMDIEYTDIAYLMVNLDHKDLTKIIKIADAISDLGLSSAFIDASFMAFENIDSVDEILSDSVDRNLCLEKEVVNNILESEWSSKIGFDKIEINLQIASDLTYKPAICFKAKEYSGLYVKSKTVFVEDFFNMLLSNGRHQEAVQNCINSGVYLIK